VTDSRPPDGSAKDRLYASLGHELTCLLGNERHAIANAANMAAFLFTRLPQVNWAGFYLRVGDELVLGPFQGKPACVRIPLGKGVCGTAAARSATLVVPDVHAFPGHIACDAESRSEIVVPVTRAAQVVGVLDVDSPEPGRFDDVDARGLERLVVIFQSSSDLGLWGGEPGA
jgi:L-methionine (R)-S-oxide reductase